MESGRSPKARRRRSWPRYRRSALASASAASSRSAWYTDAGSGLGSGILWPAIDMLPPPELAAPGGLGQPEGVPDDQVGHVLEHPAERIRLDRELVEVRRGVEEVDRVEGAVTH